jgi:hypothetical protein
LKACLLKSQQVEAWSIWSFIPWWKSVLLRGRRKWSKKVCSKTTIISIPKSYSDLLYFTYPVLWITDIWRKSNKVDAGPWFTQVFYRKYRWP